MAKVGVENVRPSQQTLRCRGSPQRAPIIWWRNSLNSTRRMAPSTGAIFASDVDTPVPPLRIKSCKKTGLFWRVVRRDQSDIASLGSPSFFLIGRRPARPRPSSLSIRRRGRALRNRPRPPAWPSGLALAPPKQSVAGLAGFFTFTHRRPPGAAVDRGASIPALSAHAAGGPGVGLRNL
jgi:hypothetical protein